MFSLAENLLVDIQLLDKLRSGDENALTLIYKKYWQPLFVSSYNILKDKQACEDIIQELFIKLWNNRHTIEITVSLKAYLFASMRYEVYRQVRAGTARADIFDELPARLQTPAAYGSVEHKELIAQVNSVVNTLPEKCREVYKLSREEYLSHKEIANRLNISTKTVENHITKALRQLRTSLGILLFALISFLLFIK
jgi:RNA polymerase sigma-70 factor (family 1)